MMQSSTDKNGAALRSALICLLLVGVYLILIAVVFRYCSEPIAYLVLGVYALILIAVFIGVLAALRQRLKEIDRGEEEEAKKY